MWCINIKHIIAHVLKSNKSERTVSWRVITRRCRRASSWSYFWSCMDGRWKSLRPVRQMYAPLVNKNSGGNLYILFLPRRKKNIHDFDSQHNQEKRIHVSASRRCVSAWTGLRPQPGDVFECGNICFAAFVCHLEFSVYLLSFRVKSRKEQFIWNRIYF